MTRPARMLPDWVMVGGGRFEGGVYVVASDEVENAVLHWHQEFPRYREETPFGQPLAPPVPPLRQWFDLSVRGKKYHVAYGATYQEALANLFAEWSPGTAERTEIGGPAQLEGGSGHG